MVQKKDETRRILFLTNSMGTGGVGNQLYNISTRIENRGNKIKIISLRPLGRFGKKTAAKGIDVDSLKIKSKLETPRALYQINKKIKEFDPDIIHTHLFHATILGRMYTVNKDIITITTVHNTYDKNPDDYRETSRDQLYRLTDNLSDLTTFVSHAARDRYIRSGVVQPDKSCCIPNGIDTNIFQPQSVNCCDKNEFVWVTVGNLQEQKDHETLLYALAQLSQYVRGFRMQIIGEGELRSDLESITNELGISDTVDYLGRVNSVPDHLCAADAFILPSRWEGFGLVVAEAMACQLPVVATNTGGPSEIVEDEKTGFLAKKGSPEDLAEKMEIIMNLSPEERDTFGKRGRQRIKNNYSIEQTVSEWVDIYEKYS